MIRGSKRYYLWLAFLFILIAWGSTGYIAQLKQGLIVTNMRDTISWAFYIGNFTFLVGVAAAAIMLVIPAYIYNWKPLKEVVIFGELLAISAVIMCMLFVVVDVGNPHDPSYWKAQPAIIPTILGFRRFKLVFLAESWSCQLSALHSFL